MPTKKKTAGGFQLSGEALEMVAGRFRALSEPSRLNILSHILDGEKTVNELVELTGMGQPNVSKHLSLLSEPGVVSRRREGLRVHYSVADDSVTALIKSAYDALSKQFSQKSRLFK
jgi:DNA-binding transcriptional ArsR family regulator